MPNLLPNQAITTTAKALVYLADELKKHRQIDDVIIGELGVDAMVKGKTKGFTAFLDFNTQPNPNEQDNSFITNLFVYRNHPAHNAMDDVLEIMDEAEQIIREFIHGRMQRDKRIKLRQIRNSQTFRRLVSAEGNSGCFAQIVVGYTPVNCYKATDYID